MNRPHPDVTEPTPSGARPRRRFLALLAGAAAAVAQVGGASGAPRPRAPLGNPFAGLQVEGVYLDLPLDPFVAFVDVSRFEAAGGAVVAVGRLEIVRDGVGPARADLPVSAVAPLAGGTGNRCGGLRLTLGPAQLDLNGIGVRLDPVEVAVAVPEEAGNLPGNLACAAAREPAGSPRRAERLARLLTRIADLARRT